MNIITRTLLGFSVLLIACKESQKEQPNSVERIEETTEITEKVIRTDTGCRPTRLLP